MSLSVKAVNSVVPKCASNLKPMASGLSAALSPLKADMVSLSGKAANVLNPLKKATNKVGAYVMKALKAVGNFFKSGVQKIVPFFKNVGNKTVSIAKNVFNWIKNLGKIVKK